MSELLYLRAPRSCHNRTPSRTSPARHTVTNLIHPQSSCAEWGIYPSGTSVTRPSTTSCFHTHQPHNFDNTMQCCSRPHPITPSMQRRLMTYNFDTQSMQHCLLTYNSDTQFMQHCFLTYNSDTLSMQRRLLTHNFPSHFMHRRLRTNSFDTQSMLHCLLTHTFATPSMQRCPRTYIFDTRSMQHPH